MIRNKLVDDLFRITDLAFCNTIMKINKNNEPSLSPEEIWISFKRLEEKLHLFNLTVFLQTLFSDEEGVIKPEPKGGYAHYK